MKFKELDLNEKLKKGLESMGFDEMMPIQEQTMEAILNGENVIGEADTGTGKTAAFLVPILNSIDYSSHNIECLIVTPTRELALQIASEVSKIGKYIKPQYVVLVGGMSMRDQVRALNDKPSIVIGTLGRINDHLRGRKINMSNIKYFILDEADEMLKEGFKEDITAINKAIPKTKQTLLFSATISKQILALSKSIMDNYRFISVKSEEATSVNIDQYYLVMKENQKFKNLTKLLDIDTPSSAIIFGRTKRRVDELNKALNKCGYKSVGIHGDLTQQQRNAVMKKFRAGEINILVATDVAARGLDISDVTHVYNFDLPQEVEFYVHRIGRTGRARKHGVSYSFIKETEIAHIRRIEKECNITITQRDIPSSKEVWGSKNSEIEEKIKKRLACIDTTQSDYFAQELLEKYGAIKLISVLIDSYSNKEKINDVSLTGEPPVVTRNKSPKRNYNDKKSSSSKRNYSDKPSRRNTMPHRRTTREK